MYLQFLDLYGNPVYLRPERVDALRGVAVTWDGKPRAATLILMTNRETFRVRGLVDVVHDAIVAWHNEQALKGRTAREISEDLHSDRMLLRAERQGDGAKFEVRPDGLSTNPHTTHQTPEGCPMITCDTPNLCTISEGFCKVVESERAEERSAPVDTDNTL